MIAFLKTADGDQGPGGCDCPLCGEDRIDFLEWLDDDTVRCHTCGTQYNPLKEDHG